jgi:hypothetical protein
MSDSTSNTNVVKYSQTILLIDKNSSIKELKVKLIESHEEFCSSLYKKCGFKKDTQFSKQTSWDTNLTITNVKETIRITVYAKTDGRANFENKYEFPPPIDSQLFFGTCCVYAEKISNNSTPEPFDLSIPLWKTIYEKLFGGFEDLINSNGNDDDDENDDDEIQLFHKSKITKSGYLKDGFVVNDNDDGVNDNDDDGVNEDESCDSITKPLKKIKNKKDIKPKSINKKEKKVKVVVTKKKKSHIIDEDDEMENDDNEDIVDNILIKTNKKQSKIKSKSFDKSSTKNLQEISEKDNDEEFLIDDNELSEENYV